MCNYRLVFLDLSNDNTISKYKFPNISMHMLESIPHTSIVLF